MGETSKINHKTENPCQKMTLNQNLHIAHKTSAQKEIKSIFEKRYSPPDPPPAPSGSNGLKEADP